MEFGVPITTFWKFVWKCVHLRARFVAKRFLPLSATCTFIASFLGLYPKSSTLKVLDMLSARWWRWLRQGVFRRCCLVNTWIKLYRLALLECHLENRDRFPPKNGRYMADKHKVRHYKPDAISLIAPCLWCLSLCLSAVYRPFLGQPPPVPQMALQKYKSIEFYSCVDKAASSENSLA